MLGSIIVELYSIAWDDCTVRGVWVPVALGPKESTETDTYRSQPTVLLSVPVAVLCTCARYKASKEECS